ncbi:MAG TPA: hypothetical protein VHA06_02210 [Candidatus Angelobacter sp.]|nr:hypothetical protein [Candidatus Angelobacter sp.]
MLNFGKTARLILVAAAPVLAVAQSPLMNPVRQPGPAPVLLQGSTSSAIPATIQQKPATTPGFQPTTAAPAPVITNAPTSTPVPVADAATPNSPLQDGTVTVEYVKGQLTVVSHGAPLGTVLKLVSTRTGAAVGLAPELQNEQVVAQLGPGSVREIVTRLLDSPKIDYILMGVGNDADSLQRIVVQSRRASGRGSMADLRPPQPAPEEELDENGKMSNGLTPDEAKMSQDELRENWKKIREQKLQAEILQQKQDREREKTEVEPPQPPPQPQNQDTAPQQ